MVNGSCMERLVQEKGSVSKECSQGELDRRSTSSTITSKRTMREPAALPVDLEHSGMESSSKRLLNYQRTSNIAAAIPAMLPAVVQRLDQPGWRLAVALANYEGMGLRKRAPVLAAAAAAAAAAIVFVLVLERGHLTACPVPRHCALRH